MAIVTRVQPRQSIQNFAYAVICLGLGLWGWWDYAVSIPKEEAAYAEFVQAEKVKSETEELVRGGTVLDDAAKERFREAEATLAKYTEKPSEPAAYDRPLNLWLYIVGCGVLGVPWFAIAQWNLQRRRYAYNDDGSLESGGVRYSADELVGIDMDRWMSKSIATVRISGDRSVLLDDYKYKGVEDIVAALAARFYPGEWTSDARPIGDPKSRDTKKAQEEEQALADRRTDDDADGAES